MVLIVIFGMDKKRLPIRHGVRPYRDFFWLYQEQPTMPKRRKQDCSQKSREARLFRWYKNGQCGATDDHNSVML